jgi:hypothetical protein
MVFRGWLLLCLMNMYEYAENQSWGAYTIPVNIACSFTSWVMQIHTFIYHYTTRLQRCVRGRHALAPIESGHWRLYQVALCLCCPQDKITALCEVQTYTRTNTVRTLEVISSGFVPLLLIRWSSLLWWVTHWGKLNSATWKPHCIQWRSLPFPTGNSHYWTARNSLQSKKVFWFWQSGWAIRIMQYTWTWMC